MKRIFSALLLTAFVATAVAELIPTRTIGDTSLVASRVVSTKPCKLFAVMGYNGGTAPQYLYIFERGTYPTNGQSAKLGPFPVSATNYFSVDLNAYGSDLDAVTVGLSTSAISFTNVATNCTIQAIIGR